MGDVQNKMMSYVNFIKQCIDDQNSLREIAFKINVSQTSLRRFLKEQGLKTNHVTEKWRKETFE